MPEKLNLFIPPFSQQILSSFSLPGTAADNRDIQNRQGPVDMEPVYQPSVSLHSMLKKWYNSCNNKCYKDNTMHK